MTYIVSVGSLTFLFDENIYPQAINFAEIAAMTNEDDAVVTIRFVPPENKIKSDTKVN